MLAVTSKMIVIANLESVSWIRTVTPIIASALEATRVMDISARRMSLVATLSTTVGSMHLVSLTLRKEATDANVIRPG